MTSFETAADRYEQWFENFRHHQTLFQPLENPDAEEIVKEGFGRGEFVVISGRRT